MSELAYAADFFMAHGHQIDEDPQLDPDREHEDDADELNDEPAIIPPPL